MSASGKLKELEGKLAVDEGYHQYVAFAALPQIVAVVSEAERQVRESHEDDVDLELAAALAALDEALS